MCCCTESHLYYCHHLIPEIPFSVDTQWEPRLYIVFIVFLLFFIVKIATDAFRDLIGCLNLYFARALVCLSDVSFEGVTSDRDQ